MKVRLGLSTQLGRDTADLGEPDTSTVVMRVEVGDAWTNAIVGGGSAGAVVGTDSTGDSVAVGTALDVGVGCANGDSDTVVGSGVAASGWVTGRAVPSLVHATMMVNAKTVDTTSKNALPIYPL